MGSARELELGIARYIDIARYGLEPSCGPKAGGTILASVSRLCHRMSCPGRWRM